MPMHPKTPSSLASSESRLGTGLPRLSSKGVVCVAAVAVVDACAGGVAERANARRRLDAARRLVRGQWSVRLRAQARLHEIRQDRVGPALAAAQPLDAHPHRPSHQRILDSQGTWRQQQ